LSQKIELRLTEVEPPAPDPKRTIYTDLVALPDPVGLGLTSRIFNYDDVGLYMRVDGYATDWTFTSNDLGLLASGANMYRNIDNFGSRAKPTTELTETITLRLRAYTDASYTDLKWTFERTVTVVFINSGDPSYTVDVLNNFDDGTVQGWAASAELGSIGEFTLKTDYVLSSPYSLGLRLDQTAGAPAEGRSRLYKSFTTPDKDLVYAIIDMRIWQAASGNYGKYFQIQRDATILVHIGRPYDTTTTHYIPLAKWIRVVVPLPRNTTIEIRIVMSWAKTGVNAWLAYLRMDDFKIISK